MRASTKTRPAAPEEDIQENCRTKRSEPPAAFRLPGETAVSVSNGWFVLPMVSVVAFDRI